MPTSRCFAMAMSSGKLPAFSRRLRLAPRGPQKQKAKRGFRELLCPWRHECLVRAKDPTVSPPACRPPLFPNGQVLPGGAIGPSTDWIGFRDDRNNLNLNWERGDNEITGRYGRENCYTSQVRELYSE